MYAHPVPGLGHHSPPSHLLLDPDKHGKCVCVCVCVCVHVHVREREREREREGRGNTRTADGKFKSRVCTSDKQSTLTYKHVQ